MAKDLKSILILIAGALLVWILLTPEDRVITNYPPRGTEIVAFGDSLVQGVGSSPGKDFVSVVSEDIGLPIANFGRAGDTTADALRRINVALARDPDIAIILLGGNDILRRVPLENTERNLREIISQFQRRGAVTMILGVRGAPIGDPHGEMYERLAEETGSLFVPDILKGFFGDRRFMADAIHPNDAGYELMAGRVRDELEKVLNRK